MKWILLFSLLSSFYLPEKGRTFSSSFSCPGRFLGPPCQEFWFADAVFIGTVKDVVAVPWNYPDPPYWQQYQKLTAKLTVEESFRGNIGSEITFEMDDCYYPFEQGEKYLVYARKGADGKLHQRNYNDRTRPLSEAKEDLDYIRNLAKMPEGGRIFGKAVNHTSLFTLRLNSEPPNLNDSIPGLRVVARNSDNIFETTTDGAGSFEFSGLPEGVYNVQAIVPNHFTGREEKVKISNRGCSPLTFSIQATGIIAGRILDSNGQAISNVTVSIFSAENVTNEMLDKVKPMYLHRDTTDKQGNFKFFRIPSGRYFIAVNFLEAVWKIGLKAKFRIKFRYE